MSMLFISLGLLPPDNVQQPWLRLDEDDAEAANAYFALLQVYLLTYLLTCLFTCLFAYLLTYLYAMHRFLAKLTQMPKS